MQRRHAVFVCNGTPKDVFSTIKARDDFLFREADTAENGSTIFVVATRVQRTMDGQAFMARFSFFLLVVDASAKEM